MTTAQTAAQILDQARTIGRANGYGSDFRYELAPSGYTVFIVTPGGRRVAGLPVGNGTVLARIQRMEG